MEQPSIQQFRITPQTAFFRSLIENLPDLVVVLDRLNRVRYASPSIESIIGYRPDEVLYQSLNRFIDSKDSPAFDQVLQTILDARKAIFQHHQSQAEPTGHIQLRLVGKDGSRRVLDCTIHDHFSDPLVGGVILNGRDTTDYVEVERALRKDRAVFQRYLDAVHAIVLAVNPEGKVLWANASACAFLGYPSTLLVGMNWFDHFIPAINRLDALAQFRHTLQENGKDIHQNELKTLTSSGEERTVSWRIGLLRDEQEVTQGVLYAGEDVTELVSSKEALKTSQERYMLALRGANDGIWDWDLMTGEVYTSPRWKEILGYAEGEVEESSDLFWRFIHPEDQEQVKAAVDVHLAGNTPKLEIEHRMLHKEGSPIWVLVRGQAIFDENGTACRMAGSLTDITARKLGEQRMVYDALHDTLTGLPNRLLFYDRLERAIKRYRRNPGFPYAVLYLDLDHFKTVNGSAGKPHRDQLLVAFGQRVLESMRSVDTLARVGGDEFVVLLEELISMDDATIVANRIQELLEKPFTIDEKEYALQTSIGVVTASQEYILPQEVQRDADIAMYRSKALGQGQVVVFQPEMRIKAINRSEIEADLQEALQEDKLELHYQPILDLVSMVVVGFEALVRWRNPQRGLMYPGEFLSIAEESGLLSKLENWVLTEACRQIQAWREQYPFNPPLTISVNLSSKRFQQESLPLQLEEIIAATGLKPDALHLELVEAALLENPRQVTSNLEKIHALGVKLHIDNFGTGYSSLSYLHTLPLDRIKIDRSFISRIGTGNTELVFSIIRLAQEMKVETIAEGVENATQFERLRSFGCQYGQGYFLGYPLPKEEVEDFLAKLVRQRRIG